MVGASKVLRGVGSRNRIVVPAVDERMTRADWSALRLRAEVIAEFARYGDFTISPG